MYATVHAYQIYYSPHSKLTSDSRLPYLLHPFSFYGILDKIFYSFHQDWTVAGPNFVLTSRDPYVVSLQLCMLDTLPEITNPITVPDLETAMNNVVDAIPYMKEMTANALASHSDFTNALKQMTMKPKHMSQELATDLAEASRSLARQYTNRLSEARHAYAESLRKEVESILQLMRMVASESAISAALQRSLRSTIVPMVVEYFHQNDVPVQGDPEPEPLSAEELQRYVSNESLSYVINVAFPGRLAGFRGSKLAGLIPNAACRVAFIGRRSTVAGDGRDMLINVDSKRSLVAILRTKSIRDHATTSGVLKIKKAQEAAFKTFTLKFPADAIEIAESL